MTTATRSAMRRRLGAHLACVGAAAGAVWGALGVSLADDGAARAALSQESDGSAGRIALLVALLSAIPLGSLLGAPVLDLVSHVAGRRSAVLAAGVLVALGAAVGVAPGSWTAVPSGRSRGSGSADTPSWYPSSPTSSPCAGTVVSCRACARWRRPERD